MKKIIGIFLVIAIFGVAVYILVTTEGPFIDDLHVLMQRVFELPSVNQVEDLLEWDDHRRQYFLETQGDLDGPEVRRFDLLTRMFKLVYQKYNLGFHELRRQLLLAIDSGFPEMEQLLADLERRSVAL